ncbi:unnamed protein product [Urochloa humidicola]
MGRPRKRPRLGQHPTPPPLPPLPLDLVVEIAGRTDPATLVRCATACKDLRRRIGDTARFRHRLRHGNHFVRALLRGHLVQHKDQVECLPANASWWCSPPAAGNKPFPTLHGRLLAARDGLLLLAPGASATTQHEQAHDAVELRVYSSATGLYQAIPPGPEPYCWFHSDYILLTGDGGGAVGRSFRVLIAQVSAVMFSYSHDRCTVVDTLSSEHGVWARTVIASPLRLSRGPMRLIGKPLVFRDAVHWLCLCFPDKNYRVLTLHLLGAAPRLTSSPELPASFPGHRCRQPHQFLLATTTTTSAAAAAGGRSRSLAVLVAEELGNVQAWSMSSERAGEWRERPQLVLGSAAIDRSRRVLENGVQLRWFGERSGVVLIRVLDHADCWWLDLRTKEVIRSSGTTPNVNCCFPYEMDLSDWVPAFHKTF